MRLIIGALRQHFEVKCGLFFLQMFTYRIAWVHFGKVTFELSNRPSRFTFYRLIFELLIRCFNNQCYWQWIHFFYINFLWKTVGIPIKSAPKTVNCFIFFFSSSLACTFQQNEFTPILSLDKTLSHPIAPMVGMKKFHKNNFNLSLFRLLQLNSIKVDNQTNKKK